MMIVIIFWSTLFIFLEGILLLEKTKIVDLTQVVANAGGLVEQKGLVD